MIKIIHLTLFALLLSQVSFAQAVDLEKKAKAIEDYRMELSPNISSDEQFEKFQKANLYLCNEVTKASPLKPEMNASEKKYLDQVLLLTARLLKIDAGKTILDCFKPYYSKNESIIFKQVQSWKSKESLYLEAKSILEETLRNSKKGSDNKPSSDEKELTLDE